MKVSAMHDAYVSTYSFLTLCSNAWQILTTRLEGRNLARVYNDIHWEIQMGTWDYKHPQRVLTRSEINEKFELVDRLIQDRKKALKEGYKNPKTFARFKCPAPAPK